MSLSAIRSRLIGHPACWTVPAEPVHRFLWQVGERIHAIAEWVQKHSMHFTRRFG